MKNDIDKAARRSGIAASCSSSTEDSRTLFLTREHEKVSVAWPAERYAALLAHRFILARPGHSIASSSSSLYGNRQADTPLFRLFLFSIIRQ